jgi:hypothetical protein
LTLLQYPLRPKERPYGDQGQLSKVEMESDKLRMSYKMTEDKNYDEAANDCKINNHIVESTRIEQTDKQPNYCVAVMKEGQMWLTPLHNFV